MLWSKGRATLRGTTAANARGATPLAAFLGNIPDGIDGVRATLKAMRANVIRFRVNPIVRMLAENIIANVPEKDYYGEAEAIHNWVRDNVRYTQDVYDVETLKDIAGDNSETDYSIITTRQGDCDDKASLTAALLQSIGHPVRFIAIATDRPDEFSHVFVSTQVGNSWYASDTTEPQAFGWRPQGVGGVIVRDI